MAFYFRRAAEVEAETPVGNVAVVADPIQQLASTRVPVPAPVLVDAGLNDGSIRAGPIQVS